MVEVAKAAAPAPEVNAAAAIDDRRAEEKVAEDVGHRPPLAVSAPPVSDEEGAPVFDEAAESAFRAEARERGETVVARVAGPEPEEADPKALPPLEQLVQKIPAEVRETLDELFRARFVRVARVPKSALKK